MAMEGAFGAFGREWRVSHLAMRVLIGLMRNICTRGNLSTKPVSLCLDRNHVFTYEYERLLSVIVVTRSVASKVEGGRHVGVPCSNPF